MRRREKKRERGERVWARRKAPKTGQNGALGLEKEAQRLPKGGQEGQKGGTNASNR